MLCGTAQHREREIDRQARNNEKVANAQRNRATEEKTLAADEMYFSTHSQPVSPRARSATPASVLDPLFLASNYCHFLCVSSLRLKEAILTCMRGVQK